MVANVTQMVIVGHNNVAMTKNVEH
jgi:hypothetical protein